MVKGPISVDLQQAFRGLPIPRIARMLNLATVAMNLFFELLQHFQHAPQRPLNACGNCFIATSGNASEPHAGNRLSNDFTTPLT